MRSTSIVLLFSVLGLYIPAHAQTPRNAEGAAAELALSNDTLQARYDTPSDIGGEGGRMAYALFLSEDRDVVGSAALLMNSDVHFGTFKVRFGPQAYAALLSEENEDVFALAIGIEARLDLVQSRGFAVVGTAYYAPDILSFGAADQLTDFMARAEMQLNDRFIGFAGYRWFRLDLTMREARRLQNELFVGVRYRL